MTTTSLHQKIQQVATYLSPWRYELPFQGQTSATLVHPDIADAQLCFRPYPQGRITISGGFPRDFYPLPERRPTITVSAERSARSIANDVARRFLPVYIPLFEEMAARARAWAEVRQQQNAALDDLARVLGIGVHRYFEGNQEGQLYHYGPQHTRIQVRPTGGTEGVTADLILDRLPLDVALEVCEVLRGMLNSRTTT